MPLVEQTRARTQELFQQLLDRYNVGSTIEVKAFYPHKEGEELRQVEPDTRWARALFLSFGYYINGEYDSSSWPACTERLVVDEGDVEIFDEYGPEEGYPAHMLGQVCPLDKSDFPERLTEDDLATLNSFDYYWYEYRNFGGPAVASTGYGLVAAALAEATNGVIASFDCAFEEENGQSAEEFLAWWGDRQMSFYGVDMFQAAAKVHFRPVITMPDGTTAFLD